MSAKDERLALAIVLEPPAPRWLDIATRHGRCPKVFLSAIALAATVPFRL